MLKSSLAVQAKLLLSKSSRHEQEHVQYYSNNSNHELTRALGRFGLSVSPPSISSPAVVTAADEAMLKGHSKGADRNDMREAVQNIARESVVGHDGLLRSSIIWILASMSRSFMGLNTTSVYGGENMERALNRPSGQALITVCNHVAAMDDPLVMSLIIPTSYYSQPSAIRWTLCATDRCFKFKSLSHLFTAAKVLPVERGAGVDQPGMRAAKERLGAGEWVHVFPEGTRSKDGSTLGPIRKGVGSLVAAAARLSSTSTSTSSDRSVNLPPLVVPFFHTGMNRVMPRGQILPSVGKKVSVIVGEPIEMGDLYQLARLKKWSDDKLHTAIASRVSSHLEMLKMRLEALESGSVEALQTSGLDQHPGSVSDKEIYDVCDAKRQGKGRGGLSELWNESFHSSSLSYYSTLKASISPPALASSWIKGSQDVTGFLSTP